MMDAPRGARIVIAGVCQQPDTIMPLMGIMKELNLQFVLGYRPADFDYVIAMIASDRIDVAPMITDIVALDDAAGRLRGAAPPHPSMQGDAGELGTLRVRDNIPIVRHGRPCAGHP